LAIEIESNLFPIPESGYSTSGFFDPLFPISLFAFQIGITLSSTSLIPGEKAKGSYFFRNDSVPLPRPCTYLAWNRLCRLGNAESTHFVIPFLPSLREEDEVGIAISERGKRVSSLSRRSPHHVRDSQKRIIWGNVYTAHARPESNVGDILVGSIDRSNFAESLVTPSAAQDPATAQEPIRSRFEFIASHGVLGLHAVNSELALPPIKRLLFQFTSQQSAAEWGVAYAECHFAIRRDKGLIEADFREMIHEHITAKQVRQQNESQEIGAEPSGRKSSSKMSRFGDIDLLNL